VDAFLEERVPAYILYRLDSRSATGDYEWLFLCYVPDRASVRDKMLYASTRATLTRELGDARFIDALFGTTREELTLAGYKEHVRHSKAAAPLTEEEEQMARMQISEVAAASIGTGSRRTHVAGVAFPVEASARDALKCLASAGHADNCVVLRLNMQGETIELDRVQTAAASELSAAIPKDVPRFTFYAYKKADGEEAIVFIYTCPSASSIRERMLYSSVRAALLTAVSELGIAVAKKMETDDVTELTPQELSSLFPSEEKSGSNSTAGIRPTAFKRPPLPGRGRPRTIKRSVQQE
ncbi:hypothetical protein SYNPS1DRAFT_19207, partial [Syncephalis pseudoplumigaleata]